jgi:hypothetical protein
LVEPIRYSASLVKSLEKSLRSAFNKKLTLTPKPKNAGERFSVSLRDGDKNDPSGYLVQNILIDDESTQFYFSFAASFQLVAHDYILEHSSLAVFHDMLELTPLFRAEFDPRNASDSGSEHAQPHWHFAQRPEHIEFIVRTLIGAPTAFDPGRKSELFGDFADCTKFHFAMSPLWVKGKALSHKQIFETADFPKWFDSLTKYVAGQIGYIIKKAPSGAKDFIPEKPNA